MNNPVIDVLEVLNEITTIHNYLIQNNERSAFFFLGSLTENLANRLRNDNDTPKDKEASKPS
jgi:hypothetical protein